MRSEKNGNAASFKIVPLEELPFTMLTKLLVIPQKVQASSCGDWSSEEKL